MATALRHCFSKWLMRKIKILCNFQKVLQNYFFSKCICYQQWMETFCWQRNTSSSLKSENRNRKEKHPRRLLVASVSSWKERSLFFLSAIQSNLKFLMEDLIAHAWNSVQTYDLSKQKRPRSAFALPSIYFSLFSQLK